MSHEEREQRAKASQVPRRKCRWLRGRERESEKKTDDEAVYWLASPRNCVTLSAADQEVQCIASKTVASAKKSQLPDTIASALHYRRTEKRRIDLQCILVVGVRRHCLFLSPFP